MKNTKPKVTKDWTRCPKCKAEVSPQGNPIFCKNCGTGIVRIT